jgi:hypothetical protein
MTHLRPMLMLPSELGVLVGRGRMISIQDSVDRYELNLRAFLGKELVADNLAYKHEQMRKTAFLFLRATCFRWAETAAELCPELSACPTVLSVGDAHLENFGLWRDADSRLVWGVNDFDEAARTPYPFDLVRLGVSALLYEDANSLEPEDVAAAVLSGYRKGLRAPRPFILEDGDFWLRELFAVSTQQRERFWKKLGQLKKAKPPSRFVAPLEEAFPEPPAKLTILARRAGVGSLGRPRFAAIAAWRGAAVVREAKAVIPSCWSRARVPDFSGKALLRAARGPYRAPDPWLNVKNGVAVRRLGPNNRKLEFADIGRLSLKLVEAMGFELANIHMGDSRRADAIAPDLSKRHGTRWLEKATIRTAAATIGDWKEYRRSSR